MSINSICPSIGWINRNVSKYKSPLQWHEARPSIKFNQCDVIMSGLIWSVHSTWGTVKLFWSPSPPKKAHVRPTLGNKMGFKGATEAFKLKFSASSCDIQLQPSKKPKHGTAAAKTQTKAKKPSLFAPGGKLAYRRLPQCHQARCHGPWSSAPSSCPAGTPCPSRARTPWAPRWHLRHCVPV